MLSVILVSAGIKEWDEFTVPAINGLNLHAKDKNFQLITVDNGGDRRGVINTTTMIPYGEAVNMAAEIAVHERLIIMNNDIDVRGDWQREVFTSSFCGPTLLVKETVTYLEGWFISIDRDLWHMAGGFNTVYRNSWEDVDLAWRLSRLGHHATKIQVPIYHYWGSTRNRYAGSNKWDALNRQYLLDRMEEARFKWRKVG